MNEKKSPEIGECLPKGLEIGANSSLSPPNHLSLQKVFRMLLGVSQLSLSSFLIFPQVYGASNVELITRTRTEHLSEQHKGKVKGNEVEAYHGRWEEPAST